MITYNHEKFIAQAIDGVLMQKTNFDFTLIIGEDFSTDNTRQICIDYQTKYPGKIKLLLNDMNMGMVPNFIQTLKAVDSTYVALCEGDDYWTDPLKLQKQIDFLEANPNFAISHHRVLILNEETKEKKFSNDNKKEISDIYDLAKGNYIYTASCVYRKQNYEFPEWFYKSPIGDFPLHLLNARFGKIKYLDDALCVYRIHDGGSWECKPRNEMNQKILDYLELLICSDFEDDIKISFVKSYNRVLLDMIKKYDELNSINARLLNFIKIYPEVFASLYITTINNLDPVKTSFLRRVFNKLMSFFSNFKA
jgi:glycosyltransferase involved in cell wall biosynthesis